MSDNTLIIYLKDPKIKKWLKARAKENHLSLSAFVAGIVEEKFANEPETENPLADLVGALEGKFSPQEMAEIDQAMALARQSHLSKPDSYYENLFK